MQTVIIDGGLPRITVETDRWAQPTEPEHHVLEIGGNIMLAMADDTEMLAGKLELLLVSLSTAGEYGFAAFDVLDSLTDTSHYLELIDDGGAWSEAVQHQFVDVFESDLLIINKVEVEPRYRGKGSGILAVRTAMSRPSLAVAASLLLSLFLFSSRDGRRQTGNLVFRFPITLRRRRHSEQLSRKSKNIGPASASVAPIGRIFGPSVRPTVSQRSRGAYGELWFQPNDSGKASVCDCERGGRRAAPQLA